MVALQWVSRRELSKKLTKSTGDPLVAQRLSDCKTDWIWHAIDCLIAVQKEC
jgi:hypothetical protein